MLCRGCCRASTQHKEMRRIGRPAQSMRGRIDVNQITVQRFQCRNMATSDDPAPPVRQTRERFGDSAPDNSAGSSDKSGFHFSHAWNGVAQTNSESSRQSTGGYRVEELVDGQHFVAKGRIRNVEGSPMREFGEVRHGILEEGDVEASFESVPTCPFNAGL